MFRSLSTCPGGQLCRAAPGRSWVTGVPAGCIQHFHRAAAAERTPNGGRALGETGDGGAGGAG